MSATGHTETKRPGQCANTAEPQSTAKPLEGKAMHVEKNNIEPAPSASYGWDLPEQMLDLMVGLPIDGELPIAHPDYECVEVEHIRRGPDGRWNVIAATHWEIQRRAA